MPDQSAPQLSSSSAQRIVIPYAPRPYQRMLHNTPSRFRVLVCHRRFGKTVWAINDAIRKVLTCPHNNPRVMYLAPYLKQARNIAWDYLLRYTAPIPGCTVNRAQLCVDFPNGGRITLGGADNVDAHRGIYLDHLICDEYAQMSPRIWTEVLRPALSDRKGTAVFLGTPKGRGNGFYDLYQRADNDESGEWAATLLTVEQTNVIDPMELESARREMSEDEFLQEYYCSWDAALRGAYWAATIAKLQQDGQICNVPHHPDLPVHTSWDLGMRDSSAIWFYQFVGREIHVVDYKEFAGTGLPDIVRQLRLLPYQYGEMVLPHDVRVRELGSGKSRLQTLQDLGVQVRIAHNLPVQDGIDIVRNTLPRMWFDAKRCQYGLDALRQYRSKYDDIKRIDSSAPEHDWTSHGADAMRYLCVTWGNGSQPGLWDGLDYSKMNRRTV